MPATGETLYIVSIPEAITTTDNFSSFTVCAGTAVLSFFTILPILLTPIRAPVQTSSPPLC